MDLINTHLLTAVVAPYFSKEQNNSPSHFRVPDS